MRFFSGFSLKNEECFFEEFINFSKYSVSGFSYGSIKAFRYVKERLEYKKRVDMLQLFSPVFFQSRSESFKKLQLRSFEKNRQNYLNRFMTSCFFPYKQMDIEMTQSTLDELEELLYYGWSVPELQSLSERGVKIEVYLGEEDKIIDVDGAREFFKDVATVTYIKDANHFLKIK